MDQNDKKVLRALEFISENTIATIEHRYKEQRWPDFRQAVPEDMEAFFIKEGYMSWAKKALPQKQYPITKKGNEYKHKLQEIRSKDWSKFAPYAAIGSLISGIGAAISIYFTGKSQGWW